MRDGMRGYQAAALIGAMLILAGCGTADEVAFDPAEILQKIRASYASTPDLTIEGSMKASGLPATLHFDAYSREYDSLKMTLTGPFGVAVGGLAATEEKFTFVSAFEGIVYTGTPDRETFARAARLSLNYRELVALMRAEIPRFPERGALARGEIEANQEDGELTYTVRMGDTVEQYIIDPEMLVILEYSQVLESDETKPEEIVRVKYDKFFIKVDDRYFPEEAVMTVDNGGMRVSVTIDRAKSGIPEGTSLSIDIPPGMDVREL